ncbi:MAG: DUF5522 domain-containing protein [Acidimicrobiales bacterium]
MAEGSDNSSSHAIRPDGLRTPHPTRLAPEHPMFHEIIHRHSTATDADEMGYMDPVTGLFAMTASYLATRPCCDRGCRHCPYLQ